MGANEFLNLYKELERTLFDKYGTAGERYENSVVRFINSEDGEPYKDKLDMCREIRNLLSHYPEEDGQNIVEPSAGVIGELRAIVNELKDPVSAMDIAVTDILHVSVHDSVLGIMHEMTKREYSHIPVLENGVLKGVFSENTIFNYIEKYRKCEVAQDTPVAKFAEFLPCEAHISEHFAFISPKISYSKIDDMFARSHKQAKRLAAVFVTADGSEKGKLMGLITAWDVLKL